MCSLVAGGLVARLGLVDAMGAVRLRRSRLFEEAELRLSPAGKAVGLASGESRKRA